MIATRHGILCAAITLILACTAGARQIIWSSPPNAVNLSSSGGAMDGSFHFELGVFTGGFVPTASNIASWSSHWSSPQDAAYSVADRFFTNSLTVTGNSQVGAKAYVWGRGGGGEWILFRNTAWTWPAQGDPMDFPLEWDASAANEVILGEINGGGSPFLMKSAAVLSYASWRDAVLTGEPLDGPGDDPDHDGCVNALEFALGTPPLLAGAPAATPVSFVEVSSQNYLQISVPRLRNRLATVLVEVSADLITWQSGASSTAEVSNTATQWIVRDLLPAGPGNPRRFMRARVVVTP